MHTIISFPEHISANVRNNITVEGMVIEKVNAECKNNNSDSLQFLIMSVDPYFLFISGLCFSNNFKYFMMLYRIIQVVSVECQMQE